MEPLKDLSKYFQEYFPGAEITITIKQPEIKYSNYSDLYMGLTYKEWFEIDPQWFTKNQHEQLQMKINYIGFDKYLKSLKEK